MMVTNYPASHEGLTASAPAQEEALSVRVVDWLRQAYCGIHGHDTLLHFQQERMSLRCVSCGHETPGWTLDHEPPRVKLRGDARRHALPRPHLVSDRKIA
jgi:hypothetical protein